MGVKIVFMSDTHDQLDRFKVPDGDILIHAGDGTNRGSAAELQRLNQHMAALPHPFKVYVPGNHDFMFQEDPERAMKIFTAAQVLIDAGTEILGLKIYGSPFTPQFYDWAFMEPRNQIHKHWDVIPEGLDFLVTHGPPYGILDRNQRGTNCGCEALRDAIGRVKPKFHVFGHIHEAYGENFNQLISPTTEFLNVSSCNGMYFPVNEPVVIDYEKA